MSASRVACLISSIPALIRWCDLIWLSAAESRQAFHTNSDNYCGKAVPISTAIYIQTKIDFFNRRLSEDSSAFHKKQDLYDWTLVMHPRCSLVDVHSFQWEDPVQLYHPSADTLHFDVALQLFSVLDSCLLIVDNTCKVKWNFCLFLVALCDVL